ncbi:MAG: hypothetical protein H6686_07735 [Fibrobacteria bacterium]|nr:hypothetical protein [Fibrobacteria bacterium]
MKIPSWSLLLLLLAAGGGSPAFGMGLEVGGGGSVGRLLGEVDGNRGREPDLVDALRFPTGWNVWTALELRAGHFLGLRSESLRFDGAILPQQDLPEDMAESIQTWTIGLEYLREVSCAGLPARVGGGVGMAFLQDDLDIGSLRLSADGTGMAGWIRASLDPSYREVVTFHFGASARWMEFPKVSGEHLESYATRLPVLALDLGLSIFFGRVAPR